MSNLVDHAEVELSLIGMGKDAPDEMNRLMHDNLIEIIEKFAEQGHSGFSASYAIGLLQKLMGFEPISDLTGDDSEWTDVSNGMWQNKRCSHVFKDKDHAYDIEGRIFYTKDDRSDTYTNGKSHVTITFPYKPKREYVKVEE
jgi:hypothetical protein